jgi:hypothetical protein
MANENSAGSSSPDDIRLWVERAKLNRLRLIMLATEPTQYGRDRAFVQMSEALAEAIETVRGLGEVIHQLSGRQTGLGNRPEVAVGGSASGRGNHTSR